MTNPLDHFNYFLDGLSSLDLGKLCCFMMSQMCWFIQSNRNMILLYGAFVDIEKLVYLVKFRLGECFTLYHKNSNDSLWVDCVSSDFIQEGG